MSGMSTYLAQKLIGHVLQGLAYPVPAGTYLALFVADPTDDNVTANEVNSATATWYGRKHITAWSAPVGSGTVSSNSNSVIFNTVTGAAVAISHYGIYDAVSGGNLLDSGPLVATKVLQIDDVMELAPGDISLDWQ